MVSPSDDLQHDVGMWQLYQHNLLDAGIENPNREAWWRYRCRDYVLSLLQYFRDIGGLLGDADPLCHFDDTNLGGINCHTVFAQK